MKGLSMTKESKLYYSYDAIVNSKKFIKDNWALRAILEKDKKYTIKEAQELLDRFLKRKVA